MLRYLIGKLLPTRLRIATSLLAMTSPLFFLHSVEGQNQSQSKAYKERYEKYNRSRETFMPPADRGTPRKVTGTIGWGRQALEFHVDHPAAKATAPPKMIPTRRPEAAPEERVTRPGWTFIRGESSTEAATDRPPSRTTDQPDAARKPVPYSDQAIKLGNAIADLPVTIKTESHDGQTEIVELDLKAVDAWKSRRKKLGPTMLTSGVDRAMQHLEKDFETWLEEPNKIAASKDFENSIRRAESALVESYQKSIGDESERKTLCDQLADLRETRLKARFGREDNYRPEVYELIYRNSRSCCAIVRQGDDRPFGTGVLLGDGLVLTCLHNFTLSGLAPDQCEVWFNYESTRLRPRQEPDVFPVGRYVCTGQPVGPLDTDLDFALLELQPNAEGIGVAELREDGEPKYPFPVLDDRQLLRDDAIYVVGHPAGAMRMVHDNAFVLFPFRTNRHGFDKLQMEVCAETRQSPDRSNELNQFIDSFVQVESGTTGLATRYEQYSLRWNGMPVFAADCDTSKGNSGSPVFDRLTNGLVGLLHAGEPDLAESFQAGWRRHEAIIPIELIVQQANQQVPGWMTRYRVRQR